jgi:hypothetical protein
MPCRGEEEKKGRPTTTTWPRDFPLSLLARCVVSTSELVAAAAAAGGLWCPVERERERGDYHIVDIIVVVVVGGRLLIRPVSGGGKRLFQLLLTQTFSWLARTVLFGETTRDD